MHHDDCSEGLLQGLPLVVRRVGDDVLGVGADVAVLQEG